MCCDANSRSFRAIFNLTAILLSALPAFGQPHTLVHADEHPRLLFRAADLERMREAVRTVPLAQARMARLIKQVDTDREITYPIPCADTNGQWAHRAYDMSSHAACCGVLYQMTGERRYADWARGLLLAWAESFDTRVNFQLAGDYHGVEVGAAGAGGNTMGYFFSGPVLTNLSLAYDCVYDALSPDEREKIKRNLFGRYVAAIEAYDHSERRPMSAPDFMVGPGQWNGANMCNMGLTAVGFVLDQPRLYERGVENFRTILGRDMLADGFWIEEDRNYSDICMQTLFTIAIMARSSGYPVDLLTITVKHLPDDAYDRAYWEGLPHADGPVSDARSLNLYLDAQLDWQYPNFGPGNWGWTPGRGSLSQSRDLIGMYMIGAAVYGDPMYRFVLSRVDPNRAGLLPCGLDPILFPGDFDKTPPVATASRWYPHGKWVVLKSIEGPDYWASDAMYAFMPYGHERSKGLQPLTLDLFAYGRVLAPRVTLAALAQNLTKDYQLNEPAWNNVMVDGCNSSGFRGKVVDSTVLYHHFAEAIKVVSAQVHILGRRQTELGASDVERHSEEDRVVGRTLAMTDRLLVDVVRVTYDLPPRYKHNFDYVLHGYGKLSIEGARGRLAQAGDITAAWTHEDGVGLRSTILSSGSRGSTKISRFSDTRTEFIVATRGNFEEHFVVVHEPVKGASRIKAITRIDDRDDVVAIAIAFDDGRTDYIALRIKPGEQAYRWNVAEGAVLELSGDYAYITRSAP